MNLAEKYGINLSFEHKTACPRCRKKGRDSTGDNLKVYGSGQGAYCWSCGFTIPSEEHMLKMGWSEEEEEEEVSTREPITPEENEKLKSITGLEGKGYRGIRDETSRYFGVRYSYDPETGEPIAQYYPATIEGRLVGYKVRRFPKDFKNPGPIGETGKTCEMFGQHRFAASRHTCLIVGGETKMLNAYQMLNDDRVRRNKTDLEPFAVVSPMIGESGAISQIKNNYEFFSKFEKIVICMDSDEAGRQAEEKIAKILPKGKAYVMRMRYKDADDYVVDKQGNLVGKEREFIVDFWNAKPWVPVGIVGSGGLIDKMDEEVNTEKIPFPDWMEEVNEMTAGGIALARIVNIGAASGIGKSTYVDECMLYWAFNSPHMVGIVSMEQTAGQYGLSMLSRYIGFNIQSIKDKLEKQIFLAQDWVKEKKQELFFKEDGSHRFYLVDDRDGTVDDLKAVVEELIITCGVKVVVLDPLQDILDGMDETEQAVFLKWEKSLVKSHGVTFININHVRKSTNGQKQNSSGAMISEEDFHGSSTIFKSAALNILLVRDKMNPDPIIRNTTLAFISKNRDNSETGPAGEFFYEIKEKKMYNKKRWLEKHGPKDF